MAFPQVSSITQTAFPSGSTTHNVNMPATVNSGDLLLAHVAFRTNPTITTPAGWTLITSGQAAGSAAGNFSGVYAKISDGTEGGTTVDFATSLSRQGAAEVYRITGAYSTTAGVEGNFVNNGSTTLPDSSSLSPSWGAEDNLWLTMVSASDDDETFSTAPTNYTDLSYIVSGGGANDGTSVGSARRELNAASENPGAFGALNEAGNCGAKTIAIRPAAAAAGGGAKLIGGKLVGGGILGGRLAA